MILIDLQKAFDPIDHEILLQKLKAIIFSESIIEWFKSYVSERMFLINIENELSEFGKISCGEQEGSILGPLLFLIYINNMPQAVSSTLLLYVDDSCILYQHKDVMKTERRLNEGLKTFVTSLLKTNWVFIVVRIRQNLFFLQANGEQKISFN